VHRIGQERFSDVVAYITIAAFAGLRSKELVAKYDGEQTLQWADVMLDRNLILVREGVAKKTRSTHSDRRYPPIEPVLAEWLRPYAKNSGPVVELSDAALRHRMTLLSKAANVKIPQNALRHSFASYWLARTGVEGVGRLAVVMGNSESVARKHYVSALMPSEGDAWFGIRRA
jgi:integrase